MTITKEKAKQIFNCHIRFIKNTIKQKINLYEPLEFRSTYKRLKNQLRQDQFKMIREKTGETDFKIFFRDIIKQYLVITAFHFLVERYIKHRVMQKLGLENLNDIRCLEVSDFIIESIEQDNFKKLKQYEERSKLKTFLSTLVSRLYNDYWRNQYRLKKHITKYDRDFEEQFDSHCVSPLERLVELEDEILKIEAAEMLPRILDTLKTDERLVIKMKYKEDSKVSAIARTIDRSRYKTDQFIKKTETKIKKIIASQLSNRKVRPGQGGNEDDTHD